MLFYRSFFLFLLSYFSNTLALQDSLRAIPNDVEVVHIVAMNHFDVGYNIKENNNSPYMLDVVNGYFDVFFPQAVNLANEMRANGTDDRFIYTTHAWLVDLYLHCPTDWNVSGVPLHCPDPTSIAAFKKSIQQGDIYFHAGLFNTEYENCDNPEAVSLQFKYAKDLADELGVPRPQVLSLRDVPGTTRALIPLLVKENITALTVGVNNGSPAPAMPNPGIWSDPATDTSILFMTTAQGQGYPDNPPQGMQKDYCVTFPNLTHAMCWAFRTDNSGPPLSVQEVLDQFAYAREQFPNAKVIASTYENFIKELTTVRDQLPVVTSEVGDNW